MLDSYSLDIISRFKQSILSKSIPRESNNVAASNRGHKLDLTSSSLNSLKPKIVEYEGTNHLVLCNDAIEKSNYRSRRKWKHFYGDSDEINTEKQGEENEDEESEESESDEEHPLKKLKLTEILSPLHHPSEIISHPAISRTFRSPIFNKLSTELIELIEVEQTNLNWLNKLLQVLNGEDWFYLLEENLGLQGYDHGLDDEKNKNKEADDNKEQSEKVLNILEDSKESEHPKGPEINPEQAKGSDDEITDPFFALPETLHNYEKRQLSNQSNDESGNLQEELINYLQVSIQRQHEYIKNLIQLRKGVVRADRLKQDLYKWGKEMHDKKSS